MQIAPFFVMKMTKHDKNVTLDVGKSMVGEQISRYSMVVKEEKTITKIRAWHNREHG